jgi:hypothetical protein
MVGRTLTDIRHRLDTLAAPDGPYYLVCARTGERPFPVDGLRFLDRHTAEEAAEVAAAYRSELRDWDPRLPYRDIIVCEDGFGTPNRSAALVDFCHEVAGATFETLTARGRDAIEDAVIDAYLVAAEQVTDRDRLCLALLRCMAAELSTLPSAEQAATLRAVTGRLSTPAAAVDPLDAALERLDGLTLVGDYEIQPALDRWTVAVDGYELADGDSVPTLPIAVELFRRTAAESVAIRAAEADENDIDWRFTVVVGADAPAGLTQIVADGSGR